MVDVGGLGVWGFGVWGLRALGLCGFNRDFAGKGLGMLIWMLSQIKAWLPELMSEADYP